MRVFRHACNVPSYIDSLPDGARSMTVKWRCPECRQKWRLHVGGSHQVAEQRGRMRRWKPAKEARREAPSDRCNACASLLEAPCPEGCGR